MLQSKDLVLLPFSNIVAIKDKFLSAQLEVNPQLAMII